MQLLLTEMAARNKYSIFLFIFLFCFCSTSFGQGNTPLLEKRVTIRQVNQSTENILQAIEKEGNFTFSYSPPVLQNQGNKTIQSVNKPIREILDKLFEGQLNYKERGNHIILTKNDVRRTEEEPSLFIISGYVTDSSGKEITEASIYDKKSNQSTISNKYGFYKLQIENKFKKQAVALNINKSNYKDTVIYVKQSGKSILNVTLYPDDINTVIDSAAYRDSLLEADRMAFINFLLSQEAEANTKNIKDTLHEEFQVSLIPYIGSNMRLSGNTINDYSLNILGGYSMGTRKAEVAGLFNIDRDSVSQFQAAGLANVVGGPVTGVQIGGLANVNLKTMEGAEFAGLVNFNKDTMQGAQFAGLVNVNLKHVSGFQAAGLINSNITTSTSTQIAGLVNHSTKLSSGVQIAGLVNSSVAEFNGVQISGLVNYAKTIHGTQIGFLNVSDSISGVPVGFLSYVHRGYHQVEISANELYPVNLSFRTGVWQFYNIFSAGMMLDSLQSIEWYFGYGVGSAVNLGRKWQMNFDLTMNQPLRGNELEYFSPLTKLNITVEKRFSKYFSIAAGPSVNYLVFDQSDDYIPQLIDDVPTHVQSSTFSNEYPARGWIGGKIAVRFF